MEEESSEQQRIMATFCEMTGADPQVAKELLGSHDWDLERSINLFLDGPPETTQTTSVWTAEPAADVEGERRSGRYPDQDAVIHVDDESDDLHRALQESIEDAAGARRAMAVDVSAGTDMGRVSTTQQDEVAGGRPSLALDQDEEELDAAMMAAVRRQSRSGSGSVRAHPILDADDGAAWDLREGARGAAGGLRLSSRGTGSEEGAEEGSGDDDDVLLVASDRQLPGSRRRERRERRRAQTAMRAVMSHVLAAGPGADLEDDEDEDDGCFMDAPLGDTPPRDAEAAAAAAAGVPLEEARMLEAAMLGIPYQAPPAASSRPVASRPPDSMVVAGRAIRQEQDEAYEESLRIDREKAARKAEAEQRAAEEAAAEASAREAAVQQAEEEQKRMRQLILEKQQRLPPEPEAEEPGTVLLMVRMPDGSRASRRFSSSAALLSVFDFLDVHCWAAADGKAPAVPPGAFNLVSQFPRRVFTPEESRERTLQEAGLDHKQESLFLELR